MNVILLNKFKFENSTTKKKQLKISLFMQIELLQDINKNSDFLS